MKACLNYLILSSAIKYHVQNPLEMRTCLDHLNYFRMLNVDPVPGSQTWFASRLCSIRPHSSVRIPTPAVCQSQFSRFPKTKTNDSVFAGISNIITGQQQCKMFLIAIPTQYTWFGHFHIHPSGQLRSRALFSRHSSAPQFIAAEDSLVVITTRRSPYPEPDIPTPHIKASIFGH